ncbi:hypothetical protein E6Q11_04225 [Candidatus Dojkabacteria bacterium]|uniref:DUF4134 domain-containing protein n=1 Tax=Candidatus Dojkabacteria bacterium TaxID=2099670 RepID=A0A5C7J6X2_9BACT|nr:MAG: hypothetical protein E6Q11_04225 [Candidatus Dojkabacteria bacterium]
MTTMIKKIAASIALLLLVASPAAVLVGAPTASAIDCTGIQNCVGGGIETTDPDGATSVDAEARVTELAQDVINIFSWVVGIISVIMVIVGGFQYITSGGDGGKVTNAKNTIMYALIGIVIVALAQVMVQFVLKKIV